MEDADKGDCENASFHSHATMYVMNVVWSILDGKDLKQGKLCAFFNWFNNCIREI